MRLALIFLISLLPYIQTLGFDFTFDDQTRVLEGPNFLNFDSLYTIFTTASWPGDLYRPVTDLSFLINKFITGLHPAPFHLTNILLHGFAAVLVYKFLSGIANDKIAFFSAILFGLHPVNSEVVSNISYRGEILALIFAVGGCIYYLRSDETKNLVYSYVLLLFAALSKENALTFLIIAPFAGFIIKREVEYKKFSVLALVFFSYLLLRYQALGSLLKANQTTGFIDNFLLYQDFSTRVLSALLIFTKYIVYFFLPYGLAADYSYAQIHEIVKWGNDELWVASFILLIFAIYLIKGTYAFLCSGKVNREVYFGVCFFLLAFTLTSNILFPIGTVFGLRLMYTPVVGLCLLTSAVLINSGLMLVLSTLPLILAGFSAYYSSFWKDNYTLWLRQQIVAPHSVRVWHTTAVRAMRSGALDAAVLAESRSLSILPEFQPGLFLLQRVYYMQGKYIQAREMLNRMGMIEKSSNYYDGLGWIELKLDQPDLAEEYFTKALAVAPNNLTSPIGLFAVYVVRNEAARAFDISKDFNESQRRDVRFKEYETTLLNRLK